MKAKYFIFVTIILLGFIGLFNIELNGSTNLEELSFRILYYGNFKYKQYEPMPGEKPLKLPILIKTWPGEFYDPPDVIEVKIEIVNNTNKTFKNIILNTKARYKVGKLINDTDGIDVEKSKQSSKWLAYHLDKISKIDSIKPNSKTISEVTSFNIEKELSRFSFKGERIWEYQVLISLKNTKTYKNITSKLPIEVIYD